PLGHVSREQLARSRQQLLERQARAAAALGLAEDVQDPGSSTILCIYRHAAAARDPVRDQEADAEHARQLVRPLAHYPVCDISVLELDSPDQVCETVWR